MTQPTKCRDNRQVWIHLAVVALATMLAVAIAPVPAYGADYARTTGTPSAQPNPVAPGEVLRWEIPITNTGTYSLAGQRLSTYVAFLPSTMTFVGVEGGWNCSEYWDYEGTLSTVTSLLCDPPDSLSLPPGETTHLAVAMTVAADVTPGVLELGAFQNPWGWWHPWGCPPGNSPPSPPSNSVSAAAEPREELADWVADCGPVGEVIIAQPAPEMTVTKAATVAEVLPGDRLDWVIEVSNAGSGDGYNVIVVDEVPEGTEVVGDPTGCGVEGRRITCAAGDLAIGATLRIEIATHVSETLPSAVLDGGVIANTATVTAASGNCQVGNTDERCSATAAVNVAAKPIPDGGGDPDQDTGLDHSETTTTTPNPQITRVVDEPSGSPTPELPRTGAATGVAAIAGAVLIATGSALVVSTRRRRNPWSAS